MIYSVHTVLTSYARDPVIFATTYKTSYHFHTLTHTVHSTSGPFIASSNILHCLVVLASFHTGEFAMENRSMSWS